MSPETASDAHDGRPGALYERLGRSIASTSIGPSIISVIARQPDPSFGGFAVEWKGQYRIEGGTFVYVDGSSGRVTAIFGYPTHKLARLR